MESRRQAQILLRAALDLLGKCDLQAIADRTVDLATRSFATSARLDLVQPDTSLYPMAASDPTGEMILLSPRFQGDHPLIRRVIRSGDTCLEPGDEERRAIWGERAVSEEIVLAAITFGRRTRGVLALLGSGLNPYESRSSDPLCRQAFVSIVSRALGKALRCEQRARTLPERDLAPARSVGKAGRSTPGPMIVGTPSACVCGRLRRSRERDNPYHYAVGMRIATSKQRRSDSGSLPGSRNHHRFAGDRNMRNAISRSFSRTLALTLTAALVPLAVSAQQQDQPTQPTDQPTAAQQQTAQQCTMQSEAIEVAAGQAAAEVNVEISDQFGAISEVEPAMGSGLALASAEDIPRAELAAGDEEPQPVQMSSEGSSATVWLNTQDVEEGTYQLTLHGDRGNCTAEVNVTSEN